MKPSMIDQVRGIVHTEGLIGLTKHVVRWPFNRVYHERARILTFTPTGKVAIPAARIAVECQLIPRELLAEYSEADQWKQSLEALDELSKMGCLFFGARHNGKLVCQFHAEIGQSSVFAVKTLLPDQTAHLRRGATVGGYRGNGIFPVLLAYAVQTLASNGMTRIVGVIDTTNAASLSSFHLVGFTIAGSIGFMDAFGLRLLYCTMPEVFGMKCPVALRRIKNM